MIEVSKMQASKLDDSKLFTIVPPELYQAMVTIIGQLPYQQVHKVMEQACKTVKYAKVRGDDIVEDVKELQNLLQKGVEQ